MYHLLNSNVNTKFIIFILCQHPKRVLSLMWLTPAATTGNILHLKYILRNHIFDSLSLYFILILYIELQNFNAQVSFNFKQYQVYGYWVYTFYTCESMYYSTMFNSFPYKCKKHKEINRKIFSLKFLPLLKSRYPKKKYNHCKKHSRLIR